MITYRCAVRVMLVGSMLAASTATAAQDQRELRDVRRQASELAQRFRRANDDVTTQEQIADEAIQLGNPYAEKVLGMANLAISKSLAAYGADFSKQIERSEKISAAGVVSSSTKLRKARTRLVQLGNIQSKLREFLNPNPGPGPGPGDEDTAQEGAPSFEKALRAEEEGAVETWLSAHGYRSLTSDETAVISAINRLRQAAGLATLEVDYKLCFAARDHSGDMARRHFFSHTSRVHGKKTFVDRAARVGTVAYAENIALCNTGVSPVTLWLNSKPHKKNIYGKWFNTIGVGRVGDNYTAMFGRKPVPK